MKKYIVGIQLTSNYKKYKSFLSTLNHILDDKKRFEFLHIKNNNDLITHIKELNILATYGISENDFLMKSEKLKWIHFGAAGIEKSLFPSILKSKIIITNSSGVHVGAVSEFTMGMILYLSKQFLECEKFKKDKDWTQWDIARKTIQLKDKTIGIIGFGHIGKAIAKKAKSFDMNVIATRRLQKKIEIKKTVDKLIPISKLNYLLSNSDYVVIACPLTPLTEKMIGSIELSMMKSSAFIINIARGAVIDEKELIKSLRNNKIAGAALDVFEKEPLDKKNPLFDLDNVFLSPHISGNFPEYQQAVIEKLAHNLNRFIAGKNLINRVCKKRQY